MLIAQMNPRWFSSLEYSRTVAQYSNETIRQVQQRLKEVFESRQSLKEVQEQPANGVGHVSGKQGEPLLSIIGKVGFAEAVTRIRYRIGQGGDGVDDLLREGAAGLQLFCNVVLHHLAKLHEIGEV